MEDVTDQRLRELLCDIADGDSLEERYAARDELLRISESANGEDLFSAIGVDREALSDEVRLRESAGGSVRLRPSDGEFAGTPGLALDSQLLFGGATLKGLVESGALDPKAWERDPELREHYRDVDLIASLGIDRTVF